MKDDVRTALRIVVGCWLVYLVFLDPYPASMATDLIGLGVAMANGEITLPEGMRAEFAYRAGRYYSGLPPGGSVPVAALHALARPVLPEDTPSLLIALSVLATVLVSAPFAALGPALLYLGVRRLGVSPAIGVESALLLAFATTNFGYGTAYFKENIATTLTVAAFAALAHARLAGSPGSDDRGGWAGGRLSPAGAVVVSGLAMGIAFACVYTSVLTAGVLALYVLAAFGVRAAALFAASSAPPAALVLWYHQVAFASPFATGYSYKAWITPHSSSFGSLDPARLFGMLLSPGYGLFVFAPALALGLLGLVGRVVRDRDPRAEVGCCLGVFAVTWIAYGHYRIPVEFFVPLPHDMGLATRYLGVTAPFLMVGYALGRTSWPERPVRLAAALTLVFGYLSAVPGLNPSFVSPLLYAISVTVTTFGAGMLFGQFLPEAFGISTLHTVIRTPEVGIGDLLSGSPLELARLSAAQAMCLALLLATLLIPAAVLRPLRRLAGAADEAVRP